VLERVGQMSRSVLVVDDDRDIREFVQIALECAGYDVEVAGGGVEAIERLEARQPELIVLDLMMPEMNGFQLAEQLRLRGLRPRIPLLVLSAASQVLYKADWIEAEGCLEKPFVVPTLLEEVARLTDRSLEDASYDS
jgi:two-component system response regulator MprA